MSIGTILTNPESGWQRIDDTDPNVIFTGTWSATTNQSLFYKSTSKRTTDINSRIRFNFVGSKIRLINQQYNSWSSNIIINIDGIDYPFSEYIASGNPCQVVVYEKTDLEFKEHYCTIRPTNSSTTELDAIDIDDNGQIKTYMTTQSLVDEVLIEFGGNIGAPYGRDQYTRIGHIQIINSIDQVDYGLNSNGATWTANASYTGYTPSNIGLPAGTSMHHNNITGYKYYDCKFSKPIDLDSLTCWSGNYNDTYYVDFPHHVRISFWYQGTLARMMETDFTQPTAIAQQNVFIGFRCINVTGIKDSISILKDYPLSLSVTPTSDLITLIADEAVLAFDGTNLRALKPGVTTITFTSSSDSTLTKTYTITAVNTLYKIYTCDYIDESKLVSLTKVEVIT